MPLLALLLITLLFGEAQATFSFRGPHTFYIGPEIYYCRRTREGGTVTDGIMYGAYASYDRVRRCALYWGIDYSVAYGQLRGHASDGTHQKSWLLDENVEARIGYTYGTKKWKKPYITPFVGYGYFYQTNRYVPPSPLEVRFRNTFPYASIGFLSGMKFNDRIDIGILFRAKWMMEGKHRITGDPDFDNVTIAMEEKWQYEVEFPIDYKRCFERRTINFRVTPFFRFRHYGGKPGFPFDFIETKFRNYGIRFLATYAF